MAKNNEDNDRKIIAVIVAAALIIIGILMYFAISKKNASTVQPTATAAIDEFAQCIKDSGAKFYGASWCPHCQDQKKEFGNSKNLPYVECAIPDGNGQQQICADAKIEGYPTWIFADGSRQSGKLSFEILSQKTGCKLPE